MVEYPIRVARSSYHGQDAEKRLKASDYNRDAALLEDHINAQIKNGKRGVFRYSIIAHELGMDHERVAKILYCVACGDNGFTIAEDSKVE